VKEETNYNGWTNRATWSVSTHLANDKHLYDTVKLLRMSDSRQFENFCYYMWTDKTPDGCDLEEVNWDEIADSWKGEDES